LAGNHPSLDDCGSKRLRFVEFVVNQVAVGLDHDAVARPTKVEDFVSASSTPAPAGGARL